jgi:hypothetical protein
LGTRAGVALALLLTGVLGANIGNAADWSVVPSVALRTEYDSNLNYDFTNKISDFLFTLTPNANFNYATEALQLQGHLGWTGLVYAKSSNIDHIDQNYGINGTYGVTPRLSLNMNAGYIVDSSLQQELTTGGIIMTRTPRQSLLAAPGFKYALTERLAATAGYLYTPVTYQDPRFQNYTNQQAILTFAYLLANEKTTLSWNFLGQDSSYTANQINRTLQFSLGVAHKVSDRWAITLNGGANYSFINSNTQVLSSTQAPGFVLAPQARLQQTSLSPYFAVYATRRWERAIFSAGYARDQSPSGAGSFNDTNGLSASFSYNFTEKLTGTMAGGFSLSQAVSQRTPYNNSYYNVSPSLNYLLTEQLSLSPGYAYSLREDLSGGRSATNHQAWLMLNYTYPPLHYQR